LRHCKIKTEVEEIVEDQEYNKYRKPNDNTAKNVIKNDGRNKL